METGHAHALNASGNGTTLARVSALVVDDETHIRVYLRHVLAALGVHTVWEGADGYEAVQLFQAHRPSFVLLDINMPYRPGSETIDRIMEIDRNAVVVMVTSQNDTATVKAFAGRGAAGYILKHNTRTEIQAMLAQVLADAGLLAAAG
jgi:two-component system chemotaxis response regulator CheY